MVQTFFVLIGLSNTVDNDFTVALAAGKRECYYQVMKKNSDVEVEYQVIDGGDLDIHFSMHGPKANMLVDQKNQEEGSFEFKVDEDGEYELCFDNGVSSYYDKIVFFEIVVDGEKDDAEDDDAYFAKIANQDATNDFEQYDKRVEDVKFRLERIRNRIEKIGHFQGSHRSHESRDRHLVEKNFERVNFWSMVNLSVMVIVLILQVVMIRSLFDEKSLISRQLTKLSALVSGNESN